MRARPCAYTPVFRALLVFVSKPRASVWEGGPAARGGRPGGRQALGSMAGSPGEGLVWLRHLKHGLFPPQSPVAGHEAGRPRLALRPRRPPPSQAPSPSVPSVPGRLPSGLGRRRDSKLENTRQRSAATSSRIRGGNVRHEIDFPRNDGRIPKIICGL